MGRANPRSGQGSCDRVLLCQMYESDGSVMVFWHALHPEDSTPGTHQQFAGSLGGAVPPRVLLPQFPPPTQDRRCLPAELLPLATSSAWVREPRAGWEGELGYGLWMGGC